METTATTTTTTTTTTAADNAPLLVATPTLGAGDLLPNWFFTDSAGKEFSFHTDSVAGRCIVIAFCPRLSPAARDLLGLLAARDESLRAMGVRVYAVIGRSETRAPGPLPFPVLIDRDAQVGPNIGANGQDPQLIVLRHNNHFAGILSGDPAAQAADAVALVERLAAHGVTRSMEMHHPPVLLIPEVFSAQDCRDLIRIYETRGQVFMQGKQALDFIGADYKMRIPEHMREDRIDHFFFDKDTVGFLMNRMNRVLPEILRAFQYPITRYESLRMACYRGSRGGYGHGHRDNVPPHQHRRFAMSINLNTDEFEGGELRFPEFGDCRYRPESGTAIVFSSSLIHEALEVTAGTRYVFLLFLFGDR